ncbi:MAG: hypothetical protein RLY31_1091 [Bacteroidota bacterium]|jgi:phosphopantetheinyl transferase
MFEWLQQHTGESLSLGIHPMEERDLEEYLAELSLTPREQAELHPLRKRRRLEWTAARWLLHQMLCEAGHTGRIPVVKDAQGKPFLADSPLHISLSHSGTLVAAALSTTPVGVDLQRKNEKIIRVSHKFVGEAEEESLTDASRLEHLHLYWCAKEALYKAYGAREVDFRRHLFVEPFPFTEKGFAQAWVRTPSAKKEYRLTFETAADYFLVCALETPDKNGSSPTDVNHLLRR